MQSQLDREKVLNKGKDVTGKLLIELQVRKSTADGKGAREFYTDLTTPSPSWAGEIRDLVLKKKLVRVLRASCLLRLRIPPVAPKDLRPAQYHYHQR